MWGWRKHQLRLPKQIRDAIGRTYRPGPEMDGEPSAAYLGAAERAERWARGRIRKHGADGTT